MSKMVRTVDELIEALGGTVATAKWAGMEHHSGVANWRERGIPPGWHLRLYAEGRRRDLEIDTERVFGLPPELARALQASFDQMARSHI